jgi:spermidine synthase
MAIGFASDDRRLRLTAAKTLSARHRRAGCFATKYWTPEVQVAAFALPRFLADIVAKAKP